MKFHIFMLLNLFNLFFFMACSQNREQTVIAAYKGGEITLSELEKRYQSLPESEKKGLADREDYFKLVRQIALEKIILDKTRQLDYAHNNKLNEKLDQIRQKIGYQILEKQNIDDKISITNQDYQPYRKLYELYQIVKRTDTLDESKISRDRRLLEKFSRQIKDLDTFKKNARQYSEDITREEDGYVGKIRLGIMDEEIDRQIKKIKPGQVSPVIETYAGFHLIFVNSITEFKVDELLKDQKLYDMIYKEKAELIEKKWHEKLLNQEKHLTIDYEPLKVKKYDPTAIIRYKEQTITRQEVFEKVDHYRQEGAFPEPSFDELQSLVQNLALRLVINDKIESKQITSQADFLNKYSQEKQYLYINHYIDQNIREIDIPRQEILDFYQANKKALFTFKTKDQITVEQNIDEVENFIIQKLKNRHIKTARYQLYRQLIDQHELNVNDQQLTLFINQIKKEKTVRAAPN